MSERTRGANDNGNGGGRGGGVLEVVQRKSDVFHWAIKRSISHRYNRPRVVYSYWMWQNDNADTAGMTRFSSHSHAYRIAYVVCVCVYA